MHIKSKLHTDGLSPCDTKNHIIQGGNFMIRNYKNYNIQQRKDGRYTVSITDHGHRTYFYGRTKKEV